MSRLQIDLIGARADVRLMARSHAFNRVMELDADHNHIVSVEELAPYHAALGEHVRSHLQLHAQDQPCAATFKGLTYEPRSQIIDVKLTYQCPSTWATLTLNQTLFSEHDPSHRVLVTIREGDYEDNVLLTSTQPDLKHHARPPKPSLPFSPTATPHPRQPPPRTPTASSWPLSWHFVVPAAITLGLLLLALVVYRRRTHP